MNMKNRKWVSALAVFVVFLLTLVFTVSGCKAEEAAPAEEAVEEEAVEEEAVEEEAVEEEIAEPITLTVWATPSATEPLKNLLGKFNEVQDKYIIDIIYFSTAYEQTILAKWAAGERPDILNFHAKWHWLAQLNPAENLVDLADQDFVQRSLYNILEQTTKVDEIVYGPCIRYPTVCGMIYNKEVFADVGLGKEDYPQNFEDFKAICQTLKDGGYIPIYEAGGDQWPLQLLPQIIGGDILRDNTPEYIDRMNINEDDFTNPIFMDSIEKVKELQDLGYLNDDILTATWEGSQQKLMSGEAGMLSAMDFTINTLIGAFSADEVNQKIGVFAMGTNYPTVVSAPGIGDSTWFVPDTGNAEKIQGAKEFMQFLTGGSPYEEYYQQFVIEDNAFAMFEGIENPEFAGPLIELSELYAMSSVLGFGSQADAHYGAFETFMQELVAGTKTPLEVCESLSEEFRKNAEAAGLEGY